MRAIGRQGQSCGGIGRRGRKNAPRIGSFDPEARSEAGRGAASTGRRQGSIRGAAGHGVPLLGIRPNGEHWAPNPGRSSAASVPPSAAGALPRDPVTAAGCGREERRGEERRPGTAPRGQGRADKNSQERSNRPTDSPPQQPIKQGTRPHRGGKMAARGRCAALRRAGGSGSAPRSGGGERRRAREGSGDFWGDLCL